MKEIPIPYLRANQIGIVCTVLIAIFTKQTLLIALLWIIQVTGLLVGAKANVFIQLAKPLLKERIKGAPTEAKELSRFNNLLAVIFLTFSLISFALGWNVTGYIFVGMLAIAATLAICGFCMGCFIYFQYKKFRYTKTVV